MVPPARKAPACKEKLISQGLQVPKWAESEPVDCNGNRIELEAQILPCDLGPISEPLFPLL